MATEIQAPNPWPRDKFTVFLAGAIDQNTAQDWQKQVVKGLSAYDVVLLNPRRSDWDTEIEQSVTDPSFVEQLSWESRGLEEASYRIFCVLADSKAPITMLELGKHLDNPGCICLEEGFYRSGNWEYEALTHGMPITHSVDDLIEHLKEMLDKKGLKGSAKEPAAEGVSSAKKSKESATSTGKTTGKVAAMPDVALTPAFKAWFNGSKVVDPTGQPLLMYHATQTDIDEFRPFTHFGTQRAANDRHDNLWEFYNNTLHNPARAQGSNIMPVYLSVVHPLRLPDLAGIGDDGTPIDNDADPDEELDAKDRQYPRGWEGEEAIATTLLERGIIDIDEFETCRDNEDAMKLLEEKGYDGIVYENVIEDPGHDSWIVFSPSQIKSAIGNSGSFDPQKSSITASVEQYIYPLHASDGDVQQMIMRLHQGHDFEDWDRLDADTYQLKTISLSAIQKDMDAIGEPTNDDGCGTLDTVQGYAAQSTPFPPIVLNRGGDIVDGFHRAWAARFRGDTTIRAYVPVPEGKTADFVSKLNDDVDVRVEYTQDSLGGGRRGMDGYTFRAYCSGQPVGHLMVADRGNQEAEIVWVVIEEPYRHKGVGWALYTYAIEYFRSKGFKKLCSGYSLTADSRKMWESYLPKKYKVQREQYANACGFSINLTAPSLSAPPESTSIVARGIAKQARSIGPVYHGTTYDFDEFKRNKGLRSGFLGMVLETDVFAYFFSESKAQAISYAKNRQQHTKQPGRLITVYLSISNMLDLTNPNWVTLPIANPPLPLHKADEDADPDSIYEDHADELDSSKGLLDYLVNYLLADTMSSEEWGNLSIDDGRSYTEERERDPVLEEGFRAYNLFDDKKVSDALRYLGFDGAKVPEGDDQEFGGESYCVFSANQVRITANVAIDRAKIADGPAQDRSFRTLTFKTEKEGEGGFLIAVTEPSPYASSNFYAPEGMKLVGYIDVRPEETLPDSEAKNAFYVFDVNVEDEWRRTGLGQELYDRAIVEAKKRGADCFMSSTDTNPASRAAWRRLSKRYKVERLGVMYYINLTPNPSAKTAKLTSRPGEGEYAGYEIAYDDAGEKQLLHELRYKAECTVAYQNVPINRLQHTQTSRETDKERVEEIKGGLGLSWIEAVLVTTTDGKNFRLSDGHHRVDAAEQAGFKTIPAIVVTVDYGQDWKIATTESATETPAFKAWFNGSKVVDADGNPLVVYHGTTENFEEFDPTKGELGNHFGTRDQATGFGGYGHLGGKVMPCYLSVKNPLRLKDVGDFGANSIVGQLADKGVISHEEFERIVWELTSRNGDANKWDKADDLLRKCIAERGYDGIVYLNRREGEGVPHEESDDFDELADEMEEDAFRAKYPGAQDSWIVFNPSQIKSALGNNGEFDSGSTSITASVPSSLPTLEEFLAHHGGVKQFFRKWAPDFKGTELPAKFDEVAAMFNGFKFPLDVYREIKLEGGIESLHTQGLGESWSWDEEATYAYNASGLPGEPWTIHARVASAAVDWFSTIALRLVKFQWDVKEIRLKEGAPVQLVAYRPTHREKFYEWTPFKKRTATAAITPADRTLYHGTNADEEFAIPQPNQHGIIWLAEEGSARDYSYIHYRKGRGRMYEVRLKPDANIVDLRDMANPFVQKCMKGLESHKRGYWAEGTKLTQLLWDTYTDFGFLEGYPWAISLARESGVDGIIVSDTSEAYNRHKDPKHDSVAIVNPDVIESCHEVEREPFT